ncbi:MAG: 6-phosphofructokinase [Clostridiales bacterium]|nr:6-phosphofructokinase [Clostridiales bacterium]
MEAKRIAVLTSGGDAPGMNACIRSIVRHGIYNGFEMVGVVKGYNGLITNEMIPMNNRSVGNIINRGGTILRTARCLEFKTEEGQKQALENIKKNNIYGVVVIGGDGSFKGCNALTKLGIPAIGIPGTIDNDLAYTDYTLGFDTAVNTVVEAITKIRDTMASHDRVSIIEVMGNKCGDIALYAGICGGAEYIIVPEYEWSYEGLCTKLEESKAAGKTSSIVIVAEGAAKGAALAEEIKKRTSMDTRTTVLGYIQRGGSPSADDVLLASRFGAHAINLIKQGIGGRCVGIKKNKIFDMDIDEACSMKKDFDKDLYDIAEILSR